MGGAESKAGDISRALGNLDLSREIWDQIQIDSIHSIQDVFSLLPSEEIRKLKEENAPNLKTLCKKLVEQLVLAVESSCRTQSDQNTVLNSCRILTRILPFLFEDPDWRIFFWAADSEQIRESEGEPALAQTLIMAVTDLMFCPDFTVSAENKGRDEVDDLENVESCELIWEKGVGFVMSPPQVPQHHANRCELLRLLLACFSQTIYMSPQVEAHIAGDRWVRLFTSPVNRHALPLFTSLLNTVIGYEPGGMLPYNHLIWSDSKEKLTELALQVLIVTLDQNPPVNASSQCSASSENLFINYLSRIHRDEDFEMILRGITRLMMNPLHQTYLPYSHRKVYFHQELLVLFWKLCEHNKRFLFFVLKSSDVLDLLVPILHYLTDARADQSRIGLMHIGVFILLLLSGERNFGVRLNKPFTLTVPIDIPTFNGTHGDLLIIVFHKIITNGHHRLQPLFECLLTILCNVSPYIKSMSMVASCKLIHLIEAFSTPWFLLANSTNHNLITFLLEVLNNIIQYQFDGNSNLIYTIIRKRAVFHNLANLATDGGAIARAVAKRNKKPKMKRSDSQTDEPMEGSTPALPAEPGTLKASLIKFPGITSLTEKSSAHPTKSQLEKLTKSVSALSLDPLSPDNEDEDETELETNLTSQQHHSLQNLTGDGGSLCTARQIQPDTQHNTGHLLDHNLEDLEKAMTNSEVTSGAPTSTAEKGLSRQQSKESKKGRLASVSEEDWKPTTEWINSWKNKLPLHTVMRLLQVLVPQVEKMCIDKGLTDETEIISFLQHGTLVGLLPVPHAILIRRYQSNPGTAMWFRTYMWGVIYLRSVDPAIWHNTAIKLFQVQRV